MQQRHHDKENPGENLSLNPQTLAKKDPRQGGRTSLSRSDDSSFKVALKQRLGKGDSDKGAVVRSSLRQSSSAPMVGSRDSSYADDDSNKKRQNDAFSKIPIQKMEIPQRRPSTSHDSVHSSLSGSGHSRTDDPERAQPAPPSMGNHQVRNKPRRGRRPVARGTHSSSDPKNQRLRVTRHMTNFMFCLLGMVPSLLLYFGHSNALHDAHALHPDGSGKTVPHHMAHHERMKKEFQQDLSKPRKPRFVVPDPYSPALLTPSEISPDQNRTVLHFVKSRFMQYQPNLTTLGWARWELFRDFCLPSIEQQTTQNFVWLIYTDPELHPDLLKAMIELLAPFPNYYLIKSLSNHMWKGGQAQNMTEATIYTGNQKQLEAFMALREVLPVLETRLDADDAIHLGYLEEIQRQAIPFFTRQHVEWMYWCVGQELEWNWLGPQGYSQDQKDFGIMESKPYEDFCPTPGLTLGYAAHTPVDSIYTRRHSMLVERLNTKTNDVCGKGRQGKDCYQIIRKFEYPAFRCRTPTSASMVMTDFSTGSKLKQRSQQDAKELDPRWQALRDSFGVPRTNVRHASNYMTREILGIAKDALLGQCTKGHSCSVSCWRSEKRRRVRACLGKSLPMFLCSCYRKMRARSWRLS